MKNIRLLLVVVFAAFTFSAHAGELNLNKQEGQSTRAEHCQFDLTVSDHTDGWILFNIWSPQALASDVTVTVKMKLLYAFPHSETVELSFVFPKGQSYLDEVWVENCCYDKLLHRGFELGNASVSPASDGVYNYSVAFSGYYGD